MLVIRALPAVLVPAKVTVPPLLWISAVPAVLAPPNSRLQAAAEVYGEATAVDDDPFTAQSDVSVPAGIAKM